MSDTTTCAHGVSLDQSCAACDAVCEEIDRTGAVAR
jgi:hypothetical protein